MKRCIFLVIIFLIPLISSAQKGKVIYLTGKVGKYSAEMTLEIKQGERQVTGFYHYTGKQAWLSLDGTSNDGTNFRVSEYPYKQNEVNGDVMATGLFTGTLDKDNNFKGEWTAPDQPALEFLFTPGNNKKGTSFTSGEAAADTIVYLENDKEKENGISISSRIEFLQTNGVSKPFSFLLDTFIYNHHSYPGMFPDHHYPLYPDYKALAEGYVLNNINYDSQVEYSSSCDVVWNGSGVLSISHNAWEYSGGAHPNSWIEFNNFDLASGKKITTDNIFIKGYEEPLRLKAIEHLEQDHDFIERDSLKLNGNFFITPEGIDFVYNAYEINCYANGMNSAFIPWSEINQWIDPKGPMGWVKK